MNPCGKTTNEKWINRQFSVLGGLIGRRPFLFLLFPIIISAALSTGFFWMETNRDLDTLYTDRYGKAGNNRKLVERLFPYNVSRFSDFTRVTGVPEAPVVLIGAKDGGSILRNETMQEVIEMYHFIVNFEVESGGGMEKFSSLCEKIYGKCIEFNLQTVMSNYQAIREGKYKIKYPFVVDSLTYTVTEYTTLLGGVKVDSNGYVEDVRALRIPYFLDFSNTTKREAIAKWQNSVYKYLYSKSFRYIDFTVLSKLTRLKSAEGLTFEILKALPTVVGIILLFSALTCVSDEWVTSKPFLGFFACVSAMLAIISGFGLGFLIGVFYQDTCLTVAYVVLALEVDDAFMLISSWRNTKPEDSVAKRMEKTFFETAPSITVTSLTNVLSCSVGIATTVPAFRMLCSMAALCSIFAYIYQIIFFGACLAISGYIEERNTLLIICSEKHLRKKDAEDKMESKKGDIFMLWFRDTIGDLLTYPLTSIFVILAFIAASAISIWGCSQVKYGNDLIDIFPSDSFLTRYVEMTFKYFDKYSMPVHVIIKDTVNYADPQVQTSIENLMRQFESHPHIANSSMRISWLSYYKIFMQHPYGKFIFRDYNMSDKMDFIDGLQYVFLRYKSAKQFNSDIIFNENYTDIVASRFILVMENINCSETEISAIKDIYDIASKSEIPVEIFGATFHILEQAMIVKKMACRIAFPAIVLTCFIFFVFSRDIRSSICVSFAVFCVVCQTVGYFSFWGVRIDMASLTVFVACIGFSINYPAHVAFAFVTESSAEPNEKIKTSIYKVGFAMTQGALSSIFSLFVLMFKQMYVLKATFKIICLMASLTIFQALFVVPTILKLLHMPKKSAVTKAVDSSNVPLFLNKERIDKNNDSFVDL